MMMNRKRQQQQNYDTGSSSTSEDDDDDDSFWSLSQLSSNDSTDNRNNNNNSNRLSHDLFSSLSSFNSSYEHVKPPTQQKKQQIKICNKPTTTTPTTTSTTDRVSTQPSTTTVSPVKKAQTTSNQPIATITHKEIATASSPIIVSLSEQNRRILAQESTQISVPKLPIKKEYIDNSGSIARGYPISKPKIRTQLNFIDFYRRRQQSELRGHYPINLENQQHQQQIQRDREKNSNGERFIPTILYNHNEFKLNTDQEQQQTEMNEQQLRIDHQIENQWNELINDRNDEHDRQQPQPQQQQPLQVVEKTTTSNMTIHQPIVKQRGNQFMMRDQLINNNRTNVIPITTRNVKSTKTVPQSATVNTTQQPSLPIITKHMTSKSTSTRDLQSIVKVESIDNNLQQLKQKQLLQQQQQKLQKNSKSSGTQTQVNTIKQVKQVEKSIQAMVTETPVKKKPVVKHETIQIQTDPFIIDNEYGQQVNSILYDNYNEFEEESSELNTILNEKNQQDDQIIQQLLLETDHKSKVNQMKLKRLVGDEYYYQTQKEKTNTITSDPKNSSTSTSSRSSSSSDSSILDEQLIQIEENKKQQRMNNLIQELKKLSTKVQVQQLNEEIERKKDIISEMPDKEQVQQQEQEQPTLTRPNLTHIQQLTINDIQKQYPTLYKRIMKYSYFKRIVSENSQMMKSKIITNRTTTMTTAVTTTATTTTASTNEKPIESITCSASTSVDSPTTSSSSEQSSEEEEAKVMKEKKKRKRKSTVRVESNNLGIQTDISTVDDNDASVLKTGIEEKKDDHDKVDSIHQTEITNATSQPDTNTTRVHNIPSNTVTTNINNDYTNKTPVVVKDVIDQETVRYTTSDTKSQLPGRNTLTGVDCIDSSSSEEDDYRPISNESEITSIHIRKRYKRQLNNKEIARYQSQISNNNITKQRVEDYFAQQAEKMMNRVLRLTSGEILKELINSKYNNQQQPTQNENDENRMREIEIRNGAMDIVRGAILSPELIQYCIDTDIPMDVISQVSSQSIIEIIESILSHSDSGIVNNQQQQLKIREWSDEEAVNGNIPVNDIDTLDRLIFTMLRMNWRDLKKTATTTITTGTSTIPKSTMSTATETETEPVVTITTTTNSSSVQTSIETIEVNPPQVKVKTVEERIIGYNGFIFNSDDNQQDHTHHSAIITQLQPPSPPSPPQPPQRQTSMKGIQTSIDQPIVATTTSTQTKDKQESQFTQTIERSEIHIQTIPEQETIGIQTNHSLLIDHNNTPQAIEITTETSTTTPVDLQEEEEKQVEEEEEPAEMNDTDYYNYSRLFLPVPEESEIEKRLRMAVMRQYYHNNNQHIDSEDDEEYSSGDVSDYDLSFMNSSMKSSSSISNSSSNSSSSSHSDSSNTTENDYSSSSVGISTISSQNTMSTFTSSTGADELLTITANAMIDFL